MREEQLPKANKMAVFVLLAASIAYHVIQGMSSAGGQQSLFHSRIELSSVALRNTIEPLANSLLSPSGN
jgi:hypothetical protein